MAIFSSRPFIFADPPPPFWNSSPILDKKWDLKKEKYAIANVMLIFDFAYNVIKDFDFSKKRVGGKRSLVG